MKTIALALTVLLALASGVRAQTLDHLKCHKMKDSLKLKATADFNALQAQYSAQGCVIGKAKLYCIPATKSNVTPPEAAPFVVDGQQLDNGFICYNVKCLDVPPDAALTDQFGSRTLTKLKSAMICAPAIQGTVTTTTTAPGQTTTTISGESCGTAGFPECNGPCPTPGNVCGDAGGHCGCVGGAPACGSYQGPPTCGGTCPGATPWCKNVSGSCSCSATP
jgi:hypothetical protein